MIRAVLFLVGWPLLIITACNGTINGATILGGLLIMGAATYHHTTETKK